MSQPAISIVLPAYNAATYIEETISSLLSQTFTDFELLVVDDGSTDNTVTLVKTFTDSRIVLIQNTQNLGLVKTLNKAVSLCNGIYIARMDADDIAGKDRLQLQKDFLDVHSDIAAVAGWVSFINEHGFETGIWDLDRKTNTAAAIKKALLRENCIAHPTVMIRTEVLKKYLYKESQQHIEDYDLWLRLVADGLQIAKVQQPVLFYRVHAASITSSKLKKRNFFFKHFNCKLKFIGSAFGKGQLNGFTISIFFSMIRDLLMGCGKAVKNAISR
jgi:glycosyltransferase involved in cell wall biosynthesis